MNTTFFLAKILSSQLFVSTLAFLSNIFSLMAGYYKSLVGPRRSSGTSSSSSSTSTSIAPSLNSKQEQKRDIPAQSKRKLQALYSEDVPRPLTAVTPRPIPNSYWATPLLLACEYPWSPKNPNRPKLDALLRAGVRTFIDLTECGELIPYTSILAQRCELLGIDASSIEYHRFAIRDRCLPDSVSHMYRVLDALRDNEERGRITAVHCRGGIGRTGMVIGCWLVESGVARDGAEALGIIAREWKSVEKCKRYPHSPETGPQFEFVARFHPSPKLRMKELDLDALELKGA